MLEYPKGAVVSSPPEQRRRSLKMLNLLLRVVIQIAVASSVRLEWGERGQDERGQKMLHANEIRKGQEQIQFSLAVLEGPRLQPRPVPLSRQTSAIAAQRALKPYEINLSVSQVLIGLVAGVGSLSLFVWALVRLWLFAR
jgi:hypothetical protein